MTDDNGMVTLNIYNQPPPQLADETSSKINETGQGFNLPLNSGVSTILGIFLKNFF